MPSMSGSRAGILTVVGILGSALSLSAQCTSQTDSLVAEIWSALETSDIERGRQVTTELAMNHADCPATHFTLGSIFMLFNQPNDAEQAFSRAIELDPEHVGAYTGRATLMVVLQREDEALSDLDRVLSLSDDVNERYEAHRLRAAVHMRRGDMNALLEEAESMIAVNPTWANSYQFRARVWVERGEWARAVVDLTTALEREPRASNNPDELARFRGANFVGRGRARIELGELTLARADLGEALDLLPESGRAYQYRARLNRMENHLEEARADLRLAIEHARTPEDREQAEALLRELGGLPRANSSSDRHIPSIPLLGTTSVGG